MNCLPSREPTARKSIRGTLAAGWPGNGGIAQPDSRLMSPGQSLPQELAPSRLFHWIISVACCRTDSGIVSPSVWAVFRLTTKSNLVGCSTGKSAGFAPFRILST
jgi:hypothetical protein